MPQQPQRLTKLLELLAKENIVFTSDHVEATWLFERGFKVSRLGNFRPTYIFYNEKREEQEMITSD
jgi:hypothetical protein